jgi:3'(2'), 5'-bisphosphate nucleotidase
LNMKDRLLETAVRAALEAGRAILEVYDTDFDVEKKGDDSPLTLADKRSHEIIKGHLGSFSIPLLSEEGRDIDYQERKDWDVLWIVDPLDGTKEFIKRNGEFTVNIALVEKQRPVMGVIYVPVKDILYFSTNTLGAYRLGGAAGLISDAPGSPSQADLIDHSEKLPKKRSREMPLTIIGSRSHATPELEAFIEAMRQEHGEIAYISAGSSLKICQVAEGKADIYPRLGPTMEWDTAAGQAIAEGAGATMARYEDGRRMHYNKENLLNPWFIVRRSP